MRKHVIGTAAPEPTQVIQTMPVVEKKDEDGNEFTSLTQDRAEPLDHNARIYFDLDPSGQGTNLYSFHTEY